MKISDCTIQQAAQRTDDLFSSIILIHYEFLVSKGR